MRAKEAEKAAEVFRRQHEAEDAAGEDVFFDTKAHASSNQVTNILADKKEEAPKVELPVEPLPDIDDAWGGDDEIDLPTGPEIMPIGEDQPAIEEENGDIFVPPAHGADPIQQSLRKNPQSVGLHVAAGEFSKAMILLKKQLGVSNFEPLRQIFIDVQTLSNMKLASLPHSSPSDY